MEEASMDEAMVASSHTPGPWATIWEGLYIVPEEHKNRPVGFSIHAEQNRDYYAQIICMMHADKFGRGTVGGNAALIAAAPDLLAACKTMIEPFALCSDEVLRQYPDTPQPVAILMARAALAKAEGR